MILGYILTVVIEKRQIREIADKIKVDFKIAVSIEDKKSNKLKKCNIYYFTICNHFCIDQVFKQSNI